jgi:hypothetical protein
MEDLNNYHAQRIEALESHVDLLQLLLEQKEAENDALKSELNSLYVQLNDKKQ